MEPRLWSALFINTLPWFRVGRELESRAWRKDEIKTGPRPTPRRQPPWETYASASAGEWGAAQHSGQDGSPVLLISGNETACGTKSRGLDLIVGRL